MDHQGDSDIKGNWCARNIPNGLLKGLEDLEIRGQVETIKTTVLSRSARILRRVLDN